MVILTNAKGNEIRPLEFNKIDIDLNEDKTFEMTIPLSDYKPDLTYGNMIFVPNSEYGGIIGKRTTNTAEMTAIIEGFTWRNVLKKKIIVPPDGQAYKVVSGELNGILTDLIEEAGLSPLFSVSTESTGVSVNSYQFDRYTTLLAGIVKMLKSVNYRIQIRFVQQEKGLPGYVGLEAVPIVDYSQKIELSQDNQVNFTFTETKNGINHLICLGKGEETDRTVIDLYVQQDGSIGTTPYYTGLNERAETYDFSNAEDAELQEQGVEKLQELMDSQSLSMDVETLNIDVDIGDIVGGRDYVTGMVMAKPVENKIYTEENGEISKDYTLEGDDGGE